MQKKPVKIILYSAFTTMLLAAGYVVFFSRHMITDSHYFRLTAAAFLVVAAAFAAFVFTGRLENAKRAKIAALICAGLVAFQLVSLPAVNLFSQTLPALPPRGTIYQFTGYGNSISQNEVGLMMRYYLKGKTLYANENYPVGPQSHNGFLFITDEYDFEEGDYPVLSKEEGEKLQTEYDKTFYSVHIQPNAKLNIPSFRISLSTETEAEKLVLVTDEKNNWYFMTPEMYEEALGE